ncbi:MAG: PTS ascorbate transporter subunit IIC, partial [Rhodospirillaceae bacterium]|nr:PTS ascorbate transporter subunit IIC [Rhodospirillaceae bacterium]
GVILGLFLAFGQAITTPMLQNTAPALAQLADPDWYIMVWVFKPQRLLIMLLGGGVTAFGAATLLYVNLI